jgi:hypothetical protein
MPGGADARLPADAVHSVQTLKAKRFISELNRLAEETYGARFRQKFTLEDGIGSHAFLSDVHSSYQLAL